MFAPPPHLVFDRLVITKLVHAERTHGRILTDAVGQLRIARLLAQSCLLQRLSRDRRRATLQRDEHIVADLFRRQRLRPTGKKQRGAEETPRAAQKAAPPDQDHRKHRRQLSDHRDQLVMM